MVLISNRQNQSFANSYQHGCEQTDRWHIPLNVVRKILDLIDNLAIHSDNAYIYLAHDSLTYREVGYRCMLSNLHRKYIEFIIKISE